MLEVTGEAVRACVVYEERAVYDAEEVTGVVLVRCWEELVLRTGVEDKEGIATGISTSVRRGCTEWRSPKGVACRRGVLVVKAAR